MQLFICTYKPEKLILIKNYTVDLRVLYFFKPEIFASN